MDIIVGGGRYGLEAARYLRESGRSFVVLDPDENCLAARELKLPPYGSGKREMYFKGGVGKLPELISELNPELVFPTAPTHVAAEMLAAKYDLEPWLDVVDCILSALPAKVVVAAGRGSIVVSYNRDHTCVQNCSAPDVCPVTKIKKPCPMYELVRYAYPWGFTLESHQLKPGLGALKGEDLMKLMEWADKQDRIVVSTACRCHGVITALKRRNRP